MQLRTIHAGDFTGKRVLTRVDFNVPLRNGVVIDDTRIRAALPTVSHLLAAGARVVLCSHLGRPKGQVDENLRLAPVAGPLTELLNADLARDGITPRNVVALADCVGAEVQAAIDGAGDLDVILLENLRFHPGETANDAEFASQLASTADLYVNDAFGTAHRAHASTEGVSHLLPAYAGFLVADEVEALSRIVRHPDSPFVIVLGGAKISGKIEVLESLIPKADVVLIGGAMANTFNRAQGHPVGASLVEDDMLDTAERMLALATESQTVLLLPEDYVVTDDLAAPRVVKTVDAGAIGDADIAADIGERTRQRYCEEIGRARTVFWNGPLGVFEVEQFSRGTTAVAQALAAIYDTAYTVVGGGESVSAVNAAGVAARIHHVSTGGGASLEFVAGKQLPGLKVLMA